MELINYVYNPETKTAEPVPFTPDEVSEWQARMRMSVNAVTPRQARIALLQANLLDAVEAAMRNADKATQLAWEYAVEFRRDDALINGIGKSLGLSDEQIDNLFIEASKL